MFTKKATADVGNSPESNSSRTSETASEIGLKFVKPGDLAKQLRMSRNVLYRSLNDGSLPARRIGKRWYISEASIKEWFDKVHVAA